MQATLTGLKYVLGIRESYIDPEVVKISIHKINQKTYKVEPCPVITIHTDVDKLAQGICNHYRNPPLRYQKGTADEQAIDSKRTSPPDPN